MNSAFKVAISTQDGRGTNIVLLDRLLDFLGDLTRISNAGHAAIAGMVESHLIEILGEAAQVKVLGDCLGARR